MNTIIYIILNYKHNMKYTKNYESKSTKILQKNSKTFKEYLSSSNYKCKKKRIYKSRKPSSSENRHRFKKNMSNETNDISVPPLPPRSSERSNSPTSEAAHQKLEDGEITAEEFEIITATLLRYSALSDAADKNLLGNELSNKKTPEFKNYKNKNKFSKKKLTFLERKLKREKKNIKKVNKQGFKIYDNIIIGINNYLYKCIISKISEKFITIKFQNDEEINCSLKNLIIMTNQANYLKELEKKRKEFRLRARKFCPWLGW